MSLVRNVFFTSALIALLAGCSGGGGGGGGTASSTTDTQNSGDALYVVSISTSGLTGTGLSVNLVSGYNSDSLSISSNGTKSFGAKLSDGTLYSVYVATQPSGQTCSLGSQSSGSISSADVTVSLSCVDNSVVQTGTRVLVDTDPLADSETITLTLNGTETQTFSSSLFTSGFSTRLQDGQTYEVTLDTPPVGKLCNLYDATGVITAGTTPKVRFVCKADTTAAYTVGGPVTGLSGNGLRLKLNGNESIAIDAGSSSYSFSTSLLSGTYYGVTVESQPVGQICTLQNEYAYISADRTDVAVICSTGPHTIGGTVTGLTGSGLTLSLNGVEDLPVSSGGSFVFPTAFSDGMDYAITVKTQPAGQECTVYRGTGSDITSSQTDTLVECVDTRYEVNVSVPPFSADTPLVLRLNGGERKEITSSSWSQTRTFNTQLEDGAAYDVTILAQPSGLRCTLSNGSGLISGANVTDISASCSEASPTTGPYPVSVTTSGLLGTGLQLRLNGGSAVDITSNGYTTLPSTLADGTSYSVDIATQPTVPLQRCHVENGSGTIASAAVTNVAVVCGNAVASLYPTNGAQWLAYVKNPDVVAGAAADTACEADVDIAAGPNACLNGGEYRVIDADYLSSCDGVSASDNLNAFDWVCDFDSTSGSVRILSTGLRSGVGLSDLIDFQEAAFKENFVTITSPVSTESTQTAVWWDNPIGVDNSGERCCSSYQNDIWLVTDNVPAFYTMANHSALLIQPGFAISGYTRSRDIVSVYDSYYDTNFTWLEGKIDDVTGGTGGGVYLKGYFTVLKNVQVTNTGGTGIHLSVPNTLLENVSSTGNAEEGMYVWGGNLYADNLTATGNRGTGPAIEITSRNAILRNITASDNPAASAGLRMPSSGDVTLENLTAHRNGGDGLNMGDWTGSAYYPSYIIRNIAANDNGGTGIFVEVIDDGQVTNLSAHRNGVDGVHLETARRTPIANIDASGNTEAGIVVYRWDQTTVNNMKSSDNGGIGVSISQSDKLIVSDILSANNGSTGVQVSAAADSIVTHVTSANNAGIGVTASDGTADRDADVFLGVTTVNNGDDGFSAGGIEASQFSSLLSAYNQGDGLYTGGFGSDDLFADVASANSGGIGIYVGGDRDRFTGLLTLGANGGGNCVLDTFVTDPGLTATGGKGTTAGTDCANTVGSDAVIVQNADLTSSTVGALATDDSANPDDTSGAALHDAISAWFTFDNDYRAWGADGAAGRCTVGSTCRIWDWSVATADLGIAGSSPALRDILAFPTGNDTLSIKWRWGQDSQAQCDLAYPGSEWDGTVGGSCTSTYLRRAVEIAGDGIGNDNYLCESNETCLFTPNIGSYQGHGDLVNAGTFIDGTLTNITLKRYTSNGR